MSKFSDLFKRKKKAGDPIVIGDPPPFDSGDILADIVPAETEPDATSSKSEGPLQTKPLESPVESGGQVTAIKYGQATDVGLIRSNNQDACLSIITDVEMVAGPPLMGFFVVADGMGGHHDGELAAKIAVQTLANQIIREVLIPQISGIKPGANQRSIPEILDEAMNFANSAVQASVPDGGTTATCLLIRGSLAFFAHVGDSRAYLYSEDGLEIITRDHSLVKRLQELGQLTEEEAEHHPRKNVLYRAIGQGDSIEIDIATRRMPTTSRVLICSDGLWGLLGDERIKEILRDEPDPQKACKMMITESNEAGGIDNITAVVIQLSGVID